MNPYHGMHGILSGYGQAHTIIKMVITNIVKVMWEMLVLEMHGKILGVLLLFIGEKDLVVDGMFLGIIGDGVHLLELIYLVEHPQQIVI
jgi:hypothetical protein